MISKEDYDFIVAFDTSDSAAREAKLKENPGQAAKAFLNLLGHVSKDQTIQYILTMIDDMLQVFIFFLIQIKFIANVNILICFIGKSQPC